MVVTSSENALSPENSGLQDLETVEPEEAQASEGPVDNSMGEFYALRRELLLSTLVISLGFFVGVLWYYGLDTAVSYALGSSVGMLYLRMLAKGVEQLSADKSVGKNRLAIIILVIFVAARWNQLEVVPVFLGFLTYKAALIYYTLRITLIS